MSTENLRTLHLKIAKPSQEDFDTLHGFLQGLEGILERNELPEGHPDEGQEPDEYGGSIDSPVIVDWLHDQWGGRWQRSGVGTCWQRVLWAGDVAIKNACDPDADVLEFKPEIQRAMDCHPDLLAACEAVLPILKTHIHPDQFDGHAARALIMVRDAIAKAKGTTT